MPTVAERALIEFQRREQEREESVRLPKSTTEEYQERRRFASPSELFYEVYPEEIRRFGSVESVIEYKQSQGMTIGIQEELERKGRKTAVRYGTGSQEVSSFAKSRGMSEAEVRRDMENIEPAQVEGAGNRLGFVPIGETSYEKQLSILKAKERIRQTGQAEYYTGKKQKQPSYYFTRTKTEGEGFSCELAVGMEEPVWRGLDSIPSRTAEQKLADERRFMASIVGLPRNRQTWYKMEYESMKNITASVPKGFMLNVTERSQYEREVDRALYEYERVKKDTVPSIMEEQFNYAMEPFYKHTEGRGKVVSDELKFLGKGTGWRLSLSAPKTKKEELMEGQKPTWKVKAPDKAFQDYTEQLISDIKYEKRREGKVKVAEYGATLASWASLGAPLGLFSVLSKAGEEISYEKGASREQSQVIGLIAGSVGLGLTQPGIGLRRPKIKGVESAGASFETLKPSVELKAETGFQTKIDTRGRSLIYGGKSESVTTLTGKQVTTGKLEAGLIDVKPRAGLKARAWRIFEGKAPETIKTDFKVETTSTQKGLIRGVEFPSGGKVEIAKLDTQAIDRMVFGKKALKTTPKPRVSVEGGTSLNEMRAIEPNRIMRSIEGLYEKVPAGRTEKIAYKFDAKAPSGKLIIGEKGRGLWVVTETKNKGYVPGLSEVKGWYEKQPLIDIKPKKITPKLEGVDFQASRRTLTEIIQGDEKALSRSLSRSGIGGKVETGKPPSYQVRSRFLSVRELEKTPVRRGLKTPDIKRTSLNQLRDYYKDLLEPKEIKTPGWTGRIDKTYQDLLGKMRKPTLKKGVDSYQIQGKKPYPLEVGEPGYDYISDVMAKEFLGRTGGTGLSYKSPLFASMSGLDTKTQVRQSQRRRQLMESMTEGLTKGLTRTTQDELSRQRIRTDTNLIDLTIGRSRTGQDQRQRQDTLQKLEQRQRQDLDKIFITHPHPQPTFTPPPYVPPIVPGLDLPKGKRKRHDLDFLTGYRFKERKKIRKAQEQDWMNALTGVAGGKKRKSPDVWIKGVLGHERAGKRPKARRRRR